MSLEQAAVRCHLNSQVGEECEERTLWETLLLSGMVWSSGRLPQPFGTELSQKMTGYVEPALHLWGEAYFIMVDELFDVLLHLVCQYFIEDFCIDVHQGYWPEGFFLVESLPGFGIRMMLVS